MTRHIFNFSFATPTSRVIDFLEESGLSFNATHDEESRLPYFRKTAGTDEVQELVDEAIRDASFTQNDIVLVGGVPDVVYYIVRHLTAATDEGCCPMILLVLGRPGNRRSEPFHVFALREILPDAQTEPPDKRRRPIYISAD